MEILTVRDTIAWKIMRQYIDHVFGSDQKMDDNDFITVYGDYIKNGGSWRSLLNGDVECFTILDNSISSMIQSKNSSET